MPHDPRRTAATGMAALEVQPHVIEAILNHASHARAGERSRVSEQLDQVSIAEVGRIATTAEDDPGNGAPRAGAPRRV